MNVQQLILLNKLDAYKDRTGDYSATRIPIYSDFVPSTVNTPIGRRTLPPPSITKYGLTRWQYWAILDKQNARCAICGDKPTRALHVDHCHQSHKVRGLICHGCNIAIGMIKEDSLTARAIADYLDKHASM